MISTTLLTSNASFGATSRRGLPRSILLSIHRPSPSRACVGTSYPKAEVASGSPSSMPQHLLKTTRLASRFAAATHGRRAPYTSTAPVSRWMWTSSTTNKCSSSAVRNAPNLSAYPWTSSFRLAKRLRKLLHLVEQTLPKEARQRRRASLRRSSHRAIRVTHR